MISGRDNSASEIQSARRAVGAPRFCSTTRTESMTTGLRISEIETRGMLSTMSRANTMSL